MSTLKGEKQLPLGEGMFQVPIPVITAMDEQSCHGSACTSLLRRCVRSWDRCLCISLMFIACYSHLIMSERPLYHFQYWLPYLLYVLVITITCLCVRMGMPQSRVAFWGQLAGICSVFSPCGALGIELRSAGFAQQSPLPTEPSPWPSYVLFKSLLLSQNQVTQGWGCGPVRGGVAVTHEALDLILSMHTHTKNQHLYVTKISKNMLNDKKKILCLYIPKNWVIIPQFLF